MVTEGQVRKLWRLLAGDVRLALAARKTGMDEKTARKYRDDTSLPSEGNSPRDWRTRPDPFAEVWPEVQARLEAEPRLRAFTLFAWIQECHPGRFPDSRRRTFERRVRDWRGLHGPSQTVMFPQIHDPGGLGASDFTNMNALEITINRQPFDHLLYHFTLTYSNWEFVAVCFSESFEAVSSGLQSALWKLGGVPHSGGHRPLGTSQRDPGVERAELPARKREETEQQTGRPAQGKELAERNQQGILIVAKAEM